MRQAVFGEISPPPETEITTTGCPSPGWIFFSHSAIGLGALKAYTGKSKTSRSPKATGAAIPFNSVR
jgi:hypothetical protein